MEGEKMRLRDQVTVVTGAGKGIGKGIAHEFVRQGAYVVIATIEPDGQRVADAFNQEIGDERAIYIHTDVTSEESIAALATQVEQRYGRVDALVNNAGVTSFKPMLEATLKDWDFLMNVDLRGVFLCSQKFIPIMQRARKGSIINISSGHAMATLPNTEMYAAAKAGVNGMTRSMALTFGKDGIRVNAVCPGFTETPHLRHWLASHSDPQASEREMLDLHVLNQIVDPQDIAMLCVYLASDESKNLTGSTLVLDGGVSARLYNAKLI